MGDEEANMAFSMEGEYEGGQWIDGEFYYVKQRDRDVMTQDDQIYGVFGGDGAFGGRRSKKGRESNLSSAPVGFVSSGTFVGETTTEPPKEEKKEDKTETKKPAFSGLGRSIKKREIKLEERAAKIKQVKQQMGQDFGKFEKHTKGIGMKILMRHGFSGRLGKNEQGRTVPVEVKLRPRNMGLAFNNFEEAGGKEKFVAPTEEGVGGEVVKTKKKSVQVAVSDNWKKDKVVKAKRVYKTATEMSAERRLKSSSSQVVLDMRGPHVRVTSLDKINEDGKPDDVPSGGSSLPELQHNVRLLVDLTEADISKLDREVQHQKNTLITLEHERDKLQASVNKESITIERLSEVVSLIEKTDEQLKKLIKENSSIEKRLEIVANSFETMQTKYPNEYKNFDLPTLLIITSFPLWKAHLHNWDPLSSPIPPPPPAPTIEDEIEAEEANVKMEDTPMEDDMDDSLAKIKLKAKIKKEQEEKTLEDNKLPMVKTLERWKILLIDERDPSQPLYRRLLQEIVLPKTRVVITQWRVREYEQLLNFLYAIKPVLIPDLYLALLTTLIIPKIKHEVDTWNPRQDTQPLDAWIHPWLPVLPDDHMQPIYRAIRYKLATVLQDWHPSDSSAYAVIAPWRLVFQQTDFHTFLGRSIVPKLKQTLVKEFVVNPTQQYVDPFTWVISWEPMIDHRVLVQLLATEFFPKWFHALYTWLNATPNFEEVSKWYLGWKGLFPDSIKENKVIKQMFNSGLDLMNEAISGHPLEPLMDTIMASIRPLNGPQGLLLLSGPPPHIPTGPPPSKGGFAPPHVPSPPHSPPPPEYKKPAVPMEEDEPISFKENVEKIAAMNNITFLPNFQRGRQDGKEIYTFGRLSIYFDEGTIYYFRGDDSSWQPISLQDLLERTRD